MKVAAQALGLPAELSPTGITLDSRAVRPGDVFLAVPGLSHDGRDFVSDAISRGAVAVVAQAPFAAAIPTSCPIVVRDDLAERISALAGMALGEPSRSLRTCAVTGTNGKTTVAWLVAQALGALGERCAAVGTLGAGVPGEQLTSTGLTTADPVALQKILARLRCEGVGAAALEASSHALHQGRLDGVSVDVAAFTNLTRDHLDYHGSMGAYGAAKARLFQFPGLLGRVINVDDAFGRDLAGRHCGATTVSTQSPADLRAFVSPSESGLELAVHLGRQQVSLRSSLVGAFNASNLLVALGALLAFEVPLTDAVAALEASTAAPGRMENIGVPDRALVVVDYAHTPDALERALSSLRAVRPHGRLVCVFGCGGDRDAGKRAPMGEIASRIADVVIVTDDNPRNESSERIVEDILAGVVPDARIRVEQDRAQAIETGLGLVEADDVLLIAGKGHEAEQVTAAGTLPFSDVEVARSAMRRRGWFE